MVTRDKLKEIFDYNPENGLFIRLVRTAPIAPAGRIAGSLKDTGYINIVIKGRPYKAHRLAWLYVYGEWPEGEIDHINHIKHDNRIANLRDVSKSENMRNVSIRKSNTSGVIGVTQYPDGKRWRADIRVDSKTMFLGLFDTKEEAITERIKANIKYGYHKNHGKSFDSK